MMGHELTCPSDDELAAFGRGLMDPRKRDRVAAHIDRCAVCYAAAVAGARTGTLADDVDEHMPTDASGGDPSQAALSRGATLGRYLVLDLVSAGGLGEVYAAYDGKLDRRVALKLLRPQRAALDLERRTVREGRALAKLSHPNVVQVYDVGMAEGRVFIAMELVEGATLSQWLREQPRRWREILDVALDSAAGLAAAHAAGLVHRDFKPANLVIDHSGRARVLDFGLARTPASASASGLPDLATLVRTGALEPITTTGMIIGTPAYMAPEQHGDRPVDARADQFMFCATFYEALYGCRPFDGSDVQARLDAIELGRLAEPIDDKHPPAYVRRALARGLAAQPDDRFASLMDLRAVLSGDRERRFRRRVAVALLVAAGGTWLGVDQLREAQLDHACTADADAIEQTWGAPAAADVSARFVAVGPSTGADTARRIAPWLDGYADRWAELRASACRRADDPRDRALAESAIACLDERHAELARVVQLFRDADIEVVRGAVSWSARLSSLETCDDDVALARRPVAPDADTRGRVQHLRARLAEAAVLRQAARLDAATSLVEAVEEEARPLAFAPLDAAVLRESALIALGRREIDEAERGLESAFFLASRSEDDDRAAEIASELVFVVGHYQADPDAALLWGRWAELILARLDRTDGLLAAQLAVNESTVHHLFGADDEALASAARGLSMLERVLGPDHPLVAEAVITYGALQSRAGDHEAALDSLARGLAILEATHGPQHPKVAAVRHDLGVVHYQRNAPCDAERELELALAIKQALGPDDLDCASTLVMLGGVHAWMADLDRAHAEIARALAIQERNFPSDHPEVAMTLSNLASVERDRGELEAASEHLERALQIVEGGLVDDQLVAQVLGVLGDVHRLQGDFERAVTVHQRVLAIREAAGKDDEGMAEILGKLGDDELAMGAPAQARRHHERAVAIAETLFAADDPRLVRYLVRLGSSTVENGDPTSAIGVLERALSLLDEERSWPGEAADVELALSMALTHANRDHDRAVALAQDARAHAGSDPQRRERIDGWLAQRAKPRPGHG